LWIVHTYLLDSFGISPRLAITSPEKQCGKTTLLDVLEHLVWRPLPTTNTSASAIFRVVEISRPCLLADEADTYLPDNNELRGILNSGHRRNGQVLRNVGDNHEPRRFATYSACAIGMIGKLPGTLADRSVRVELRRRRPDEPVELFRFDRVDHLHELARKARRWATDNADAVRQADPILPAGMFNRVADNWRPLLAIADVAEGDWPTLARAAAKAAAGAAEDDSRRTMILSDIRAIFAEKGVAQLPSAEIVEALKALEGRPWAEWGKSGKPITQHGLAALLRPFGIGPDKLLIADRKPNGYRLSLMEDAFTRYLDPHPPRSEWRSGENPYGTGVFCIFASGDRFSPSPL